MSWQISATILPDAQQKNINVTNTTGTYSIANPGGSGGPNPTDAQVISAVLQITIPDPTTYLPSASTISIDLFALGYPVAPTVQITNVALGLSPTATIPDGQYGYVLTMVSNLDSGSITSTYETEGVLYFNAQCCIFTLTSSLVSCGCGSSVKQQKQINIFKANLGLATINYQSCNTSKAVEALLYAQEICTEQGGCGGCGGC